jgi:hypothetical protein
MSTILRGSLNVASNQSNTAYLNCCLGEFIVRDDRITTLAKGEYAGCFEITAIAPNSTVTKGRLVVEVNATIDMMTFENASLPEQGPAGVAKEASIATTVAPTEDKTVSDSEVTTYQTSSSAQAGDAELFGELWPLGQTVKLDMTVGRDVIHQQNKRLDQLGYEFDSRNQIWLKKLAAQRAA